MLACCPKQATAAPSSFARTHRSRRTPPHSAPPCPPLPRRARAAPPCTPACRQAQDVALRLGVRDQHAPSRAAFALLHVLTRAADNDGHTYVLWPELHHKAARELAKVAPNGPAADADGRLGDGALMGTAAAGTVAGAEAGAGGSGAPPAEWRLLVPKQPLPSAFPDPSTDGFFIEDGARMLLVGMQAGEELALGWGWWWGWGGWQVAGCGQQLG